MTVLMYEGGISSACNGKQSAFRLKISYRVNVGTADGLMMRKRTVKVRANQYPVKFMFLLKLHLNILPLVEMISFAAFGVNRRSADIMSQTQMLLSTMGEQIKMARLRRKLSVDLVSERAGISRASLWAVEKGSPSVAMGIYAAVLHALNGMDKDLLKIAKDDELGRMLQDMDLPIRRRAPKRKSQDDQAYH